MMTKITIPLTLVLLALHASSLFAQSAPPQALIGCLDSFGNIYNLAPKGKPVERCLGTDLSVELGSGNITGISLGEGLIGGGISGDVGIDIDPKFALPPSCPPGQVALSDDQGGWVCTPPNLLTNQNPVAKLWVIPHFTHPFGRGPRLGLGTRLRLVNTSNENGEVSFLSFSADGNLLLDLSLSRSVSIGERTFYRQDPRDQTDAVWMIVVSDVNIMVSAFLRDSASGISNAVSRARNVVAYPVDCRFPDGYEFVCQFAAN